MNTKSVNHVLYVRNHSLLTNSEKKFYSVLVDILPGAYILFSKVRIPDIVHLPPWYKRYQWSIYWWDRIQAKHVDFLVCDKKTFAPLLVIEVDDPSHERADRKKRDNLVDFVFKKADLPIIHINNESLEKENFKESILKHF